MFKYFLYFQLNGNDHLKWVDINGGQHTMTGISCNTPIPAWSNLTNTVTDKSILPITKAKMISKISSVPQKGGGQKI